MHTHVTGTYKPPNKMLRRTDIARSRALVLLRPAGLPGDVGLPGGGSDTQPTCSAGLGRALRRLKTRISMSCCKRLFFYWVQAHKTHTVRNTENACVRVLNFLEKIQKIGTTLGFEP
jgi:hypothetical protein